MRIPMACAALLTMGLAAPAAAQQQTQQPSTGERVLRGVLDSLLGPAEQPATQQVAEQEATPAPSAQTLADVLAHPRRDEDRARDAWRHPAETLEFFRIRPGMTVVDYMPATGWYSRVLIPWLGREGTYIGLNPELHPELTGYWDMYRNAESRIPRDARDWVGYDGARVIGANTDTVHSALEGTADRFLIFREVHNMRRFGWLHDSLLAAHRLLKEDGLLGVVQHRVGANAPFAYTDGSKGYQREQDVIALFGAYGFELVARSEINANPADPANWPGGVWSLPPSLNGADTEAERQRRTAIGESDRMTLLFRKRS